MLRLKAVKVKNQSNTNNHPRWSFNIASGLFLIFLGIVFLLNKLGLLPWDVWEQLWKFWPIFIIVMIINYLLGTSIFSKILMFFISLFAIIVIVFFTLPLISTNLSHSPNFNFKLNTLLNLNPVSEHFQVSEYEKLDVNTPGSLTLKKGYTNSVTIETNKAYLDNIEVEVKNNTLFIKHKNLWSNIQLNLTNTIITVITTSQLNSIKVAGSTEVNVTEPIKTNTLDLNISGSGEIYLEADVKNLISKISGSGDIHLNGKAVNHQLTIIGSGDILANNLESQKTIVKISGSGKAEVNTIQILDIFITGSGDVIYTGKATVNQFVSGSGEVKQK